MAAQGKTTVTQGGGLLPREYTSKQVEQYLQRLREVHPEHYEELVALQKFLLRHGHGAALPEVRWRIQTSSHIEMMGEIRVAPPFPPYRILFAMPPSEEWLVLLVAGNKAEGKHTGNGWYSAWVPIADALLSRFIDEIA